MKAFVLILALTVSSTAFSRQYIQCSDPNSSELAVVNINPTRSTLMLSPGMDSNDYILVTIKWGRSTAQSNIFLIQDEKHHGEVLVPLEVTGRDSDNTEIVVDMDDVKLKYSCFSRIYAE